MEDLRHAPAVITVNTPNLDFVDGYKVQKEAEIYFREHIFNLIIDLSQVNYISSRGLGMLVDIHRKCEKGKGKLVVFGAGQDLMNILNLTALDKYFNMAKSKEEAVKKLLK